MNPELLTAIQHLEQASAHLKECSEKSIFESRPSRAVTFGMQSTTIDNCIHLLRSLLAAEQDHAA
jgi:hypothetical protein